jgi:outer membrane protein OmpA-like peptidoglycan-associated protein
MAVALISAVLALILLTQPVGPPGTAEVAVAPPSPPPPAEVVVPAGPPPTDEVVVVLSGTVVVERGGERTVLDQPYATSRIGREGTLKRETLSQQQVQESFGSALAALPRRPATFMLHFVRGSDELIEDSKAELQRMLAELRSRALPDIVLIGHADTVGRDELNDELSLQRAERVKALVVEQGIAAQRIRTAGRGKRELLVPTADGVDEPRNRRVEINVR